MKELFILSGIRGHINTFSSELIEKIAISYGLWLKNKDQRKVIISRDTRPSSKGIKESVIKGLLKTSCQVYDVGISPSPITIFTKNRLKISGGIIITGSQNPPEINGMRFLSNKTYVNDHELKEINSLSEHLDYSQYNKKSINISENVIRMNAIPEYLNNLYSKIKPNRTKDRGNLKIIVDTGAGTCKEIVPELLKSLGCEVIEINSIVTGNNKYPRKLSLNEKNLELLIKKVWEEKADLGLAYDINGHRFRIVGDDYKCYAKDISLALIAEDFFRKHSKKCIFVTNIASSLRLDKIANEYDVKVIKTAIGEFFIALKMESVMREKPNMLVLGGEGTSGGVIIPNFNNTRDAIYATAKLIEILSEGDKTISSLVSGLPKYFKFIEKINIEGIEIKPLIKRVKEELLSEGEKVFQMGNDLRIDKDCKNFVLIHPSTTEQSIKVIAEAKRKSLARILSQTTAKLVEINIE